MMKQEVTRLKDDLQRHAGLTPTLDRMAELKKERDSEEAELEKALETISDIVQILEDGGYLQSLAGIIEK
jgi:hypothetical protein